MIDWPAIVAANSTEVGDCREWTGAYGTGSNSSTPFYRRNLQGVKLQLAVPRELWKHLNGPVPEGHMVFRTCCNYRCVARKHLAAGPKGSPRKQAALLGRAGLSPSTIAAITLARRRIGKYTPEQVARVRELIAEGLSGAEAGRVAGVDGSTARDIKNGRGWKDAPASSVWVWRPA